MRSVHVYFDDEILDFKEDEVTLFKLRLEALRDNEQLKNEVLAYIKLKFDSFFSKLKTVLEKSKEEEVSEG
ncbi:hypothetical protein DRP04_11280 [Archaeoglobales archaeon]|nr:MAG: hypothetical protein DRP04_11280 [Archaeoglobales archaeon]